jgi:hypothetical protein
MTQMSFKIFVITALLFTTKQVSSANLSTTSLSTIGEKALRPNLMARLFSTKQVSVVPLPAIVNEKSCSNSSKIIKDSVALPYIQKSKQQLAGNWEGTFTLLDKTVVTHTSDHIIIDSRHSEGRQPKSFIHANIQKTSNTYYYNLKGFNGFELKNPMFLDVDSTRFDFVNSLIRSGLYEGTAGEQAAYATCGNWQKKINFRPSEKKKMTITHTLHDFIINEGTSSQIRTNTLHIRRTMRFNDTTKKYACQIPHASSESEILSALKQATKVIFPEIQYFEGNKPRDYEESEPEEYDEPSILTEYEEEFTLTLTNNCIFTRKGNLIRIENRTDKENQSSVSSVKFYIKKYTFDINTIKSTIYANSKKSDIINELIGLGLYACTPKEDDFYHYSANWCCTFPLIDGSTIRHTPYSIIHDNGAEIKKYQEIYSEELSNFVLDHPLHLRTKSTFTQFLTALIETGAIRPAARKEKKDPP